jgi:hypothetical protein
LIVYRFFLDPGMKIAAYPENGCPGCTARMGWADWPWYTTADDFSADFDVSEWFGINVFLRDGAEIYRSYYTTAPGRRGTQQHLGTAGHHAVRSPGGVAGRAATTNTPPRNSTFARDKREISGPGSEHLPATGYQFVEVRMLLP